MNDVRGELGKIASNSRWKTERNPIFRTARNGKGRQADKVADRLEGRMRDGRRIDAHVYTLPKQVLGQTVQRTVRAVPHHVVIARNQGNANLVGLHGQQHLKVEAAKAKCRTNGSDRVKVGLPPIAPQDARLFILGSLPGDASLAAQRYYAHPRNQFWRLVGSVIGEDLHSLEYEQRLERLAAHRIGLWDVIGSAMRRGSLDQAIRLANHNRVEQLVHDFPQIEAIAFNGTTAAAIGRKLIGTVRGLQLIDLPSSSPANTFPVAKKAIAWARLASFCGYAPCAARRSGQDG